MGNKFKYWLNKLLHDFKICKNKTFLEHPVCLVFKKSGYDRKNISYMIVKQNDITCVYENIIFDDNNDDGDNYLGCVPIPNDT